MQPIPLTYEVVVEPGTPHPAPGAVSFRTGPTVPDEPTYDDLEPFWWDLVAGRPLPLKLVIRQVDDERTLLAVALFLHRDLAVHPRMPNVLTASAFWRVRPDWGLSHVDRDLGRFLAFLRAAVPPSGLDRRTLGERMASAVRWIREYVTEDRLPPLPPMPMPMILDVGTNGFVVAATTLGSLKDGWLDLFRLGHLRGVLVQELPDGRRSVMVARKSEWTALNLHAAAEVFNAMEAAMGSPFTWTVTGDRLVGQVTEIRVEDLVRVLVRC